MQEHNRRTRQFLTIAFIVTSLVALSMVSASAQGFMVKPMILELTPSPGEVIQQSVEIRNTLTQAQTVRVRTQALTQSPNGAWQASPPENAPEGSRSALDFMEISTQQLDLDGHQGGRVELTFRVPQRARGFYGAALLVNSVPPEGEPGTVAMVVQFLIPIIMQIEGRPAREDIAITDLGMQCVEGGTRAVSPSQTREFPPTTEATMKISNTGETLGRVAGELTISGMVNDEWRHVARIDLRQRSLIPGAEFKMTSDLHRRLPSGKYKLSATMRLGGRFAGREERIIEHEGDPEIKTLATDVPLMMDDLVQVEAASGGTRSTSFTIENPTETDVSVATAIATPGNLRGVALGDLDGQELSAADWVELNPDRFRLRGGGSRTVRVIARAPEDLSDHPHFYADLHIGAFYPDGQSAGRWKTVIDAAVPGVDSAPRCKLENVLVSEGEDGYIVTARFTNIGDVHVRPSCTAALRDTDAIRMQTELTSETGIALPLSVMEWSGTLSLGGVKPGDYMLEVSLKYGAEATAGQVPVRISKTEDGETQMTVLEDTDAAQESADGGE